MQKLPYTAFAAYIMKYVYYSKDSNGCVFVTIKRREYQGLKWAEENEAFCEDYGE